MSGTTPTRRLLIYAHFDPEGIVRDHVVHALGAMKSVCSEIRFVTTAQLRPGEMGKLAAHVAESVEVENIGFDFWMWKTAMRPRDVETFDEIVLMNSSVHGPFCAPSVLFDSMRGEACDAWGITESLELDRHLQSYFLVFRKKVLVSGAFRTFWESVLPLRNKRQVIRSYEIGLSQWLEGNGFILAAYCPWRQVVRYLAANPRHAVPVARAQNIVVRWGLRTTAFLLRVLHVPYVRPTNPTIAYPEELLRLGVPFLKLEVLRDNPFGRDLSAIRRQLGSQGYALPETTPPPHAPVQDGMATIPVPTCPVCGSAGRQLHAGLRDVLRSGTSGTWSVRKCDARDCGCAWLDPAPLESEIHEAYTAYYTHAEPGESRIKYIPPTRGPLERALLTALKLLLGVLRIGPRREAFWLHGLKEGGGRLLEVGCGDGSRLLALEKKGWAVEGQEIDLAAASHARSKGLRVHVGRIEELGLEEASFDVILMSHVVEHLHRPLDVLRSCRKLLRGGGRLVISTPNIESLGHRLYGGKWLALDPPRHLIVHSRPSLRGLLARVGLADVSVRTVPLNSELIAMHSRDIKYLGWTDMDSGPRVGQELVPVAVQLAALLLHPLAPGSGEECLAIASAPRAPEREIVPAMDARPAPDRRT